MERIAFTLRILPEQVDDLRATADDFNAALDEFVATQRDAGLTSLCVWLQATEDGPAMVFFLEGDLPRYFSNARTAAGVEAYIRQKLRDWTGTDIDPPEILNYPQGEELFAWRSEA